MRIELLHIDGCPNTGPAESRLREAVASAGLDGVAEVGTRLLSTPDDAGAAFFAGSPTFLLDGADLFPGADRTTDLACRVYPTDAGLAGAPTVDQLRAALLAATRQR
ncbi:alkylmercury lyase [Microterricola viridarii]|uniref:Alkylmercury lyase n=1 Tax=Microterricola viridarii TaxID=412690 RepID=A0A0Y0P8D0_9MICO|nr:alkylmercury lyase [Microterricola viridarii]AMB60519.1 alkylmercury lyase [Microterricola viridarii]